MNKEKIIKIIFFWRLEKEKWIEIIIKNIEDLKKKKELNNFKFYIFWEWKYGNTIKEKYKDNVYEHKWDIINNSINDDEEYNNKNIIMFWWRKKEEIDIILSNSNYCYMPSLFLETFWLSALESIKAWIPVIWFRKWWTKQFIDNKLSIENYKWNDLYEKSLNMLMKLKELNINEWTEMSKSCLKLSEKYSSELWIKELKNIIWDDVKDILMISDYKDNIWWIENYIYNTMNLIDKYKIKSKFIWSENIKNKIIRKLWLLKTAYNINFNKVIKKEIKKKKYDIIWLHSVTRYIWWKWIENLKKFEGKKIIMYHDLWYFHPYPSKVYDESQIKKFSLWNYIKSANTKNPIKILLVTLKYISINKIRKILLENIDIHLIPSEFMKKILIKWWIEENKIKVLKHYKI